MTALRKIGIRDVEGPGYGFLGHLAKIKDQGILKFFEENSAAYGDIIPFRIGFTEYLQINNPAIVKHILMDNHKNYYKGSSHARFRDILGHGILTSAGEKWKRDRQMIQPAFRKDLLQTAYFDAIVSAAEDQAFKWERLAQKGEPANVTADMSSLTLRVILQTVFGLNFSNNALFEERITQVDESIQALMEYVGLPRIIPSLDLNKFFCRKKYLQSRLHKNRIREFVYRIYQYEKQNPSDRANMVSLMIKAESETGYKFSFEDIFDQSITMIFAGYETTATLLQWVWYCLDKNPEVQERLRAELKSANSECLSAADLDHLPVLDAVIKETLRLYPPFWATTRRSYQEDHILGYTIPAGQDVVLPQYTIHRHPALWDEPEEFRIERFLNGNEQSIPAGAYFPFSLGARKCIGNRFAEMEARIVIALLLPKFRLTVCQGQNTEIKPIVSLKFKDDLRMHVSPQPCIQS